MKKILLLLVLLLTINFVNAQNTCATALPVSSGITVVGTINGTEAPPQNCGQTIAGATAAEWYAYTPTANHTVTVTTDLPINIGDDPQVHIYTGTCGNLVCVAGDDNSGTLGNPDLLSVVTFNALVGVTHYIVFDNKWSASGVSFKLNEAPFVIPPVSLVSFTPQSISLSGYKDCVVDMNNDYLDDIVGINNNSVQILKQNVGGGFTSVTIPTPTTNYMPSWSIASGDIDKNGYNDLLYGDGNGVTFMKQNDTGTGFTMMGTTEYVFSQRSNFVDLNNDGNLDAFVCHDVQPNVFYTNDGAGNYSFTQGGMGDFPTGGNYGSIFVDYDNDGDPDLFIAKCRGGNSGANVDELFKNNGDGTFTDVSVIAGMAEPSQSWSSAWADYDNDGDMDAMIGASAFTDGGHKLRRNNGDGTFTDITVGSGLDNFEPTNIENNAHDYNNDGWVDIFMGGNNILMNNGDFTFSVNPVAPTNGPIGDLNNDGFLDVQNDNTVYYNVGNNNGWFKVNLLGIESNRNGIGARVELHGDWGVQIRDVRSGDGFRNMSSLNVHFGIGTAQNINKVVVKWPSGVVDQVMNPGKNQTLLITESSTLGINDNRNTAFNIAPNPASDVINFEFNTNQGTITKATIFDLTGRLIQTSEINNQKVAIDKLASGTYILSLTNAEGKSFVHKFIKK